MRSSVSLRKVCRLWHGLSRGHELWHNICGSPRIRSSHNLVNLSDNSSCEGDSVLIVIETLEDKSGFELISLLEASVDLLAGGLGVWIQFEHEALGQLASVEQLLGDILGGYKGAESESKD